MGSASFGESRKGAFQNLNEDQRRLRIQELRSKIDNGEFHQEKCVREVVDKIVDCFDTFLDSY